MARTSGPGWAVVKAEATQRDYVEVKLPSTAPYGRAVWVALDKGTLAYVAASLMDAAKDAPSNPKEAKPERQTKSSANAPDIQAMIAAAVAAALAGTAVPVTNGNGSAPVDTSV